MNQNTTAVLRVMKAAAVEGVWLAKHEIAESCEPRMNDHAVSARMSDLRKAGHKIVKFRGPGQYYYLYRLVTP